MMFTVLNHRMPISIHFCPVWLAIAKNGKLSCATRQRNNFRAGHDIKNTDVFKNDT